MKVTADTSVLIAAFASWHEHHHAAVAAMARVDVVIAHCMVETYSVLTRLPAPHRIEAQVVEAYLRIELERLPMVALPAREHGGIVRACAGEGITGGAVYDAVIAATAARARAMLLTFDRRARPTYAAIGAQHELLA